MSAFSEARRRSRRNIRRILKRASLRQVSVHLGDAPQAYHPLAELQRLGVKRADRFTTALGFPRFFDAPESIVTRRESLSYARPINLEAPARKRRTTRAPQARRLVTYLDSKGFRRQRWIAS